MVHWMNNFSSWRNGCFHCRTITRWAWAHLISLLEDWFKFLSLISNVPMILKFTILEKKIVKWSSILVFTNLCFWPDIKRKWDILQTSTTNGIYWRTFWSDSFLTFLTNSYSRRLSMDMFQCFISVIFQFPRSFPRP